MSTKSMTLLIILATLVIGIAIGALSTGALRQRREDRFDRMPPQRRFHKAMERIIQPTDEQREAIQKILKHRFDQLSAIRQEHENEIIAIYDSMRVDFESILTEEQRTRLEERLRKGPHDMMQARVDRLAEKLQLDASQKKRIEEIMSTLLALPSRQRREFKGDRRESRQSIRKRFKKLHEEIEKVLTPEQIEEYREMREFGHPPVADPPFHRPFARPPLDKDLPEGVKQ